VQTSAERSEDAAVVVRFESTAGQGRLPRRPGARHACRHLGRRSRPGVVIDRELSLAAVFTAVCRSGRQLRPVVRSFSVNTTKTLVQTFILCRLERLDYCNSMLYGISDRLIRRLQSAQNAAHLPGYRRSSLWPHYTSATAAALHWLPVHQRVVFKIARLAHQSLGGAAPAYLADNYRLLSDIGRRPLRSNSNDMRKLLVPRTHNKLGDRSFSAAGPWLCNDLPPGLRRPGLSTWFLRQSLKTYILATEVHSDCIEFRRCIINLTIYLFIYLTTFHREAVAAAARGAGDGVVQECWGDSDSPSCHVLFMRTVCR